MKKVIVTMALVLTMCLGSVTANAATYIPDDITYQNLNGQQMAVKVYTLLPDQNPEDLVEQEFEYDGYRYVYSGTTKEEQHFEEENLHTETVTVNTPTNNLEDILSELKPTIEFDNGTAKGTLALDHSTIKTEAAGYKTSSYTVTATKNFTGLDRNDSSYIDKTVVKNGRTLSLSNVTWSVESTVLVGDELVPATYAATATYSAQASTKKATGYVTTADYTGKVTSSGLSSIQYTVTFIGTELEPNMQPVPAAVYIVGGGAAIALLAVLLLAALYRKNITVYEATGKGNEYTKCGRLFLRVKQPEMRIDHLKHIPEGMIAIEVDEKTARKLFGKTIHIHYFDRDYDHTVGTVNGAYWFKIDVGEAPDDAQKKEEP